MQLIFLLCFTSSFIYQAASERGFLEEKNLLHRVVWKIPELSCSGHTPRDATSRQFESFGVSWSIFFFHEYAKDPVLISVDRYRGRDKDVYLTLHLKKFDGTETTLIPSQLFQPDDDALFDRFTVNTSMKCSEFSSPAYRDAPKLRKNITVTLHLWTVDWEKDKSATCAEISTEGTNDGSKSSDAELDSTSTLLKNLENLLMTGNDHDVVFKVRYREFKAHRSLLRARSPVFADMFRHADKDWSNDSIPIMDCEPETFGDFLLYVYTGKLEDQTPARVMSLYYVADKYKIPILKTMCVETLKTSLSITVVSDVISFATKHNKSDLLQSSELFFSKHMEEIMVTEEWQRFLASYPSQANTLFLKTVKTYYKKIDRQKP